MLTFAFSVQHGCRSFRQKLGKRKKYEAYKLEREIELSLFADYIILYVENPKDSMHASKLLELIHGASPMI